MGRALMLIAGASLISQAVVGARHGDRWFAISSAFLGGFFIGAAVMAWAVRLARQQGRI